MSQSDGYAKIPVGALAALSGDGSADVAVYLPQPEDAKPILYQPNVGENGTWDVPGIRQNGVPHLYVRSQDLSKCETILETRLTELLGQTAIEPDEKARLVRQVATSVARDLTTSASSTPDFARVSNVVDNVIACVVDDPFVAGHMLHMAGHERTIASHMFVVSALAVILGVEVCGDDPEMLEALGHAGMLHDIGKLAINAEILNKPGPLTTEEMSIIEHHPIESVRMLGGDPQANHLVRQFIVQHHERVDGKGYPVGISGKDLLLGSRILAIVDSFHAMIGRRPYRSAMTPYEANRVINSLSGKQFDARLVRCWNALFERCWTAGASEQGHEDREQTDEEPSIRYENSMKEPLRTSFHQRAERAKCDDGVTIRCVYAGRLEEVTNAPDEFTASVKDVSRGGLCMTTPHPMYRGEIVNLQLKKKTKRVWVRGLVAWCKQIKGTSYRTGVRFLSRISDHKVHNKIPVRGLNQQWCEKCADVDKSFTTSTSTNQVTCSCQTAPQDSRYGGLEALERIARQRDVSLDDERTVVKLSTFDAAEVRLRAVDVLAKLSSRLTRAALVDLLDDPDDVVLERAISFVGALGMHEAVGRLRGLLDDECLTVVLRAAGALGQLGDSAGLRYTVRALYVEGPEALLAARMLGEIVKQRFGANEKGLEAARSYVALRQEFDALGAA